MPSSLLHTKTSQPDLFGFDPVSQPQEHEQVEKRRSLVEPLISETPALTKAVLTDLVHMQLGLNKRESKEIIECVFDEIATALVNRREVKLSAFGNFNLRDKPSRPGRNPRTGEETVVTARRVVTFLASQKLRMYIDNGGKQNGVATKLSDAGE